MELVACHCCLGSWHNPAQVSIAQLESLTAFGIRGSLAAHLCLLCATLPQEGVAGKWHISRLAVSTWGCPCKLCLFSTLVSLSIARYGQITHCISQNTGGRG